MPVSKKKSTTSTPTPSSSEQASPVLPDQATFHQHLRNQIRSAVQTVMEEVMREELTQFLGTAWGECTPQRRGYRNGNYIRDLATSSGPIEDLRVPRDREGHFHTQAFERYSRYEPQVAEGLTQMFVAGVPTEKIGEGAETLMGGAPSASSVSRLNQTLTQQFEAWRERSLQGHYRVIYLDGVHFTVCHGEQCDATIILTALGVDLEGNREVLALRACAEESKEGWLSLLQDVRTRGATQIDLIVTDGHDGLLGAAAELFSATPRQRCLVHKQRNVLAAIPRRERGEVQAELVGIWEQPTKPEPLIQFAAFKATHPQRYPDPL